MNPFISLQTSTQYGNAEVYLVNVNHIIRLTRSGEGSKVTTTAGEFYCDEKPAGIAAMINEVFTGSAS